MPETPARIDRLSQNKLDFFHTSVKKNAAPFLFKTGKPNVRNIERNVSWLLLLALTLMLTAQIIARYVFFTSINWIEEFSRIVFVWFIYLSISWIIIQGRHIRVTALDMILPDLQGGSRRSPSSPTPFQAPLQYRTMTYYGALHSSSGVKSRIIRKPTYSKFRKRSFTASSPSASLS